MPFAGTNPVCSRSLIPLLMFLSMKLMFVTFTEGFSSVQYPTRQHVLTVRTRIHKESQRVNQKVSESSSEWGDGDIYLSEEAQLWTVAAKSTDHRTLNSIKKTLSTCWLLLIWLCWLTMLVVLLLIYLLLMLAAAITVISGRCCSQSEDSALLRCQPVILKLS